MIWYVLKTYGGKFSSWHLCEECFDETRVWVIANAARSNAKIDDPERLVDLATWHETTMEDLYGTAQFELYCSGPCGEYEENPDFVPQELVDELIEPFTPVRETGQQVRYFNNMPPSDPETADKKPTKKKKSWYDSATNTAFWEAR